jgi:deoxyribonuclease IV
MRFGFHISIAGGLSRVAQRAEARGCETIQLFSRNPRGWQYSPLKTDAVRAFRSGVESLGLSPVVIHLPYLPNIASSRSRFYSRSLDSITTDLERADELGADYLIIHIGHRLTSSEEEAIQTVSGSIDRVLQTVRNRVVLLLENTAGQGSEIGSTFEQIQKIIEGVNETERLGVCLDTAHCFEAGYDLSSPSGIDETLRRFDATIGLRRLHLLHLNDSKSALGSHRDRHWHIGEGLIGSKGFRHLINHPSLKNLPGIMETPRNDTVEDLKNMAAVRALVDTGSKSTKETRGKC